MYMSQTENQNDPCGPRPLTPNDLLTMKTGVVVQPPGEFQREDMYGRKRWRQVQYLANQFWTRWKREYLANLQARQKWTKTSRNLKVGDIVLMKDEDLVRSHWKMARVVVARVVEAKKPSRYSASKGPLGGGGGLYFLKSLGGGGGQEMSTPLGGGTLF